MKKATELALVLDFGSPHAENLARLARDAGVYTEIKPGNITAKEVSALKPSAIILAVNAASGMTPDSGISKLRLPLLTIDAVSATTADLKQRLTAFLDTCDLERDYNLDGYIKDQIAQIRAKVGSERVLLALSGGVDSSVCAALLSKAIPGQLYCIFVDHGFLRQNEGDQVEAAFGKMDLNLIRINAQDRFIDKLKGVADPEAKRKLVGAEFIDVFKEEAAKLGNITFLAQGTIYPDIVESGIPGKSVIKSHHNVGGLPEDMGFNHLVEPLAGLFKDEVRAVGVKLGLPKTSVMRQPFPGPGLSVRVVGEVTREKLEVLRAADAIFREEVDRRRSRPDQYFAVHTGVRAVGILDGARSYGAVIALRAVDTADFMTCGYTKLPHSLLARVASRIITEVPGAGRVVYDVTSKPPGTIEWE